MRVRFAKWTLCTLVLAAAAVPAAQRAPFNWHDDYTEYNLLEPSSHQFHIVYYLTQRQVGATTVSNQTRSGSEGSNISVTDPRTGEPLEFTYASGAELSAAGAGGRLQPDEHYILAVLPRPVPDGGEGRVRIEKTYLDEQSYYADGDGIVFARSLGIGRNAIVLPAGYSLVSSNVAAQVAAVADGRLKVSFENVNGYASDVVIRARETGVDAASGLPVVERASDFSKTSYDLKDPATHEVLVRHEYTETTLGARSTPAFLERHRLVGLTAMDMDTGQRLVPIQMGASAAISMVSPIGLESVRIGLSGTERDGGYRVADGQLLWEKMLYEPRTTVLLPAGWQLVAASAPAVVTTTRDGRVAIQVVNPRVEPVVFSLSAAR
jgi:hypothetical protein